jgi:hypothetical protein
MYGCNFICPYYFIWSNRIILVFVSSILLASTIAFAGISPKRQDILKLIGTTYAPNRKFAWIELNGEDYGWTREGENVGKYRIVMVEMGKVIVESGRKKLVLVMLKRTQLIQTTNYEYKTFRATNRFF